MPGPNPTKQEIKALGSFCEIERQVQRFTEENRAVNRQLLQSRKQAIDAVVRMMESNQWAVVALSGELRAATNAKYVRALKSHTTKELSDKFVTVVLNEHFDELVALVDGAESPEAAAQSLRAAMWELLKKERVHYRTTVDFSNNKPRAVSSSELVSLDDLGGRDSTTFADALHAMHTSRTAWEENRSRARAVKAQSEEQRAKFYDKVKAFMERTDTKRQVIQASDGNEYTLKYTTARKTMPLKAAECQSAIEAAIDTFMQMHESHILENGLRGGFVARAKESLVELVVSEMKQRRGQTQKSVVRLLKRRGGHDEEEEEGGSGGDGSEEENDYE